ncbi:MAG: hypothetical protein JO345_19990 [Streptosporangiaceae bacterium]|nr:hypothetical protein [Streptosporangiaceae bacterium]
MSLTEDQRKQLVAVLRPLLSELFDEEQAARALLADIGRVRARQSDWRNSDAFWEAELRALLRGAIRDGIEALIAAAAAEWPGNDRLQEMLSDALVEAATPDGQAPEDEDAEEAAEDTDATGKPDLSGARIVEEFHTLTLMGSERHDEFLRLVRQHADPNAELCYATTVQSGQLPQAAVLIADPGQRSAQIEEQLQSEVRGWGEGVAVEYQTSEVRPYLLRRIVVSRADNTRFELRNVPSTTVLSEIARAVLQHTDDSAGSASGRRGRVRTTIHRVRPDGNADRLEPAHTLSAAGLQDGDELRLDTEATAGRGTALWRTSVLRARAQIHQYASKHPKFVIVETDDVNLPTRYTVEFPARGFAPPLDLETWPLSPRLQSEHRVTIMLPARFPVAPPLAVFESEIFHPNVLAVQKGPAPKGFACLGAVTDAYRPDMDFGQLCQMLVDMAGYRQYEPRDMSEEDSEGYLNRPAARWASSEPGQQRIADRGGLRLAEVSGKDDGAPPRLDIQPLDQDWEAYEDEG